MQILYRGIITLIHAIVCLSTTHINAQYFTQSICVNAKNRKTIFRKLKVFFLLLLCTRVFFVLCFCFYFYFYVLSVGARKRPEKNSVMLSDDGILVLFLFIFGVFFLYIYVSFYETQLQNRKTKKTLIQTQLCNNSSLSYISSKNHTYSFYFTINKIKTVFFCFVLVKIESESNFFGFVLFR